MIYLKTIIYVLFFLLIVNSPFFVSYYNIKYYNLIFIILPILGIIFSYLFFKMIGIKRFNPLIFRLKLNSNVALFIASFCTILVLQKFDINKFISGNITDIRDDFNQFEVSTIDQILPILLVYPLVYILWLFAVPNVKKNWKFYAIILCLMIFGISSGGRAFIFIFILSYFFIAKPKLYSYKNLLVFISFVSLFGFITLGRVNKDLEFDTATYIEASAPVMFNEYLKGEEINGNISNIIIQTVFYFGHSIPAFCNKVDNLDIQILPRSIFGLQPFIERQLIRTGLVETDQTKSYMEMLGLAKKSNFFEQSWSTSFLDVYFHEGVIFSIIFFILIALIFYQTNLNLEKTNSVKYKIITGFNVVFIITFFLTPVFMDTTWFFSFILIYLSKNELKISE